MKTESGCKLFYKLDDNVRFGVQEGKCLSFAKDKQNLITKITFNN